MTARRQHDRLRKARRTPRSAIVYSACLVLAAGWYALQALHVTIANPPPLPRDRTARLTIFFEYFRSTVPQQCMAMLIASAGFAALYVLTERTNSISDYEWPARLCRLGAALFITAQLIQVGGYRYIYDTSLPAGRDLTADLVALQLVDAIDDALELGAFALLGAGMIGLGLATHISPATRGWSALVDPDRSALPRACRRNGRRRVERRGRAADRRRHDRGTDLGPHAHPCDRQHRTTRTVHCSAERRPADRPRSRRTRCEPTHRQQCAGPGTPWRIATLMSRQRCSRPAPRRQHARCGSEWACARPAVHRA